MDGIEKALDEVFVKKAPVQLPENAKKSIVEYSPYLALIIGVLSLLGALSLWRIGHRVDTAINYLNSYSVAAGYGKVTHSLGVFYYLALASLAAQGALYLAAFPGLKARKKAGWNFLFFGLILEAVYSVVSLFDSNYLGGSNFIGGLIGLIIGGYFLFQIRSHYLGGKAPKASEAKAPEDTAEKK